MFSSSGGRQEEGQTLMRWVTRFCIGSYPKYTKQPLEDPEQERGPLIPSALTGLFIETQSELCSVFEWHGADLSSLWRNQQHCYAMHDNLDFKRSSAAGASEYMETLMISLERGGRDFQSVGSPLWYCKCTFPIPCSQGQPPSRYSVSLYWSLKR